MSVTHTYRYACCEMNGFFFDVFISHFPKIHRNVLCKITTDQLFLRCLRQSMRKKCDRSTACKAKAAFPVKYFKAEAVIGRHFSKFHFSSLFISSSNLLFY